MARERSEEDKDQLGERSMIQFQRETRQKEEEGVFMSGERNARI